MKKKAQAQAKANGTGKVKDSRRRSTLSDLARELNVDVSTISLALRDSRKVSEGMKKKIRALADRRGYVPNAHARALAGGKSSLLGVILPCVGIPFYATMLDLLYEEAKRQGYRVEAQFHQWGEEREISNIRSMVEHRAEGIVSFSSFRNPPKILQEALFKDDGIPVSFWGRQPIGAGVTELKDYIRGFVTTDIGLGAKMAAEHLLELGHRRIALLSFEQKGRAVKEKMKGIKDAMKGFCDAELVPVHLPASFPKALQGVASARTFEAEVLIAREFLKQKPLPTAVMTTDDTAAQVLMSELHYHGLRVPEDVSIASSGNTFYSQYGAVPLSCINVPFELISKKLVDLVTGPPATAKRREYAIEPHFVSRSSTASLIYREKR